MTSTQTTRKTNHYLRVLALVAALAASLLVAMAAQPANAAFPGKNGRIVFASDRTTGPGVDNPTGDDEIFSMNPDGTGLTQLTNNTTSDVRPTYSSDGQKIAFESDRTGNLEIFVMNSDGTGQTNLTNDPTSDRSFDSDPAFSPDGQKIAFISNRAAGFDIFVMNSDGSGTPIQLTDNGAQQPAFSPDGKKIAFASSRAGDSDIFVMNSDGSGTPANLSGGTAFDFSPSYSPDGKKIAFQSDRDGDPDIFVMDTSGSTPRVRLTSSSASDFQPAFSPDGKKIAFTSDRAGNADVYTMNVDGSFQSPFASTLAFEGTPDWQPDIAPITFTVNFTGDQPDLNVGDGICDVATSTGEACTLRAAIEEANASPSADTIRFNIPETFRDPVSGVATIKPTSGLPLVTQPVTIDGYTQPAASPNTLAKGTNANILIELDGSAAEFGATGLHVSTSGSVIKGLAINRFGQDGIRVSGNNNMVEGNFIGTDPSGTQDLGNTSQGVRIAEGAFNTFVGGTSPSQRNLISGNGLQGVHISDSSGNQVQGNHIGTDKSGMADLGNGGSGVVVGNRTSSTVIGGATAGAGNVVSGNDKAGLDIIGSQGTKVLGNRIGIAASGTAALGNTGSGVVVGAANTSVGDGSRDGSNTIAFNGSDGVLIAGSSTNTGNEVSRNSIFSNVGLGIDLFGNDGPTPNDPLDADTGANNLQNTPTLSSAKTVSGLTTVKGELDSVANEGYTIRFFSNPKDTNEGKNFIGQKTLTTTGDGLRTFTFTPTKAVAAGQVITATAARVSTGDTSEFSAPRKVVAS